MTSVSDCARADNPSSPGTEFLEKQTLVTPVICRHFQRITFIWFYTEYTRIRTISEEGKISPPGKILMLTEGLFQGLFVDLRRIAFTPALIQMFTIWNMHISLTLSAHNFFGIIFLWLLKLYKMFAWFFSCRQSWAGPADSSQPQVDTAVMSNKPVTCCNLRTNQIENESTRLVSRSHMAILTTKYIQLRYGWIWTVFKKIC